MIFAQKLLRIERCSEIIEIFAFVKTMIPGTTIDYELMTEAFLKEACRTFPGGRGQGDEGKELLEYFSQCYLEDQTMSSLFSSSFSDVHFS